MTSNALPESTEKMTIIRWIPFALILMAAIVMGRQLNLGGLVAPLYQGLAKPLLNMCHLMFLMLGCTVAFCITRRSYEMILLAVGIAGGIWIQQVFGYIPGARLVSGLSLLFLLLILWLPEKLAAFSSPIITLSAFAHGIWLASDGLTASAPAQERVFFMLGAVASHAALGFAWGASLRDFKEKSQSAYEGIEHLLVATVAGTALVYIYWGLFKQA